MNKTVTVLGGTGFVGQRICARLDGLGYNIKVITRDTEAAKDTRLCPHAQAIEGDVFDSDLLRKAFNGSSTVINLIGILNERGHDGSGFYKVHTELPRLVADTCKVVGVERLVHMSALNADAVHGPSHYLRTKGKGEDAVHEAATSRFAVTSFQPSVIFGENDSFFNRFASLLRITPLVFPLACADARFAPVYVGDVANRFVSAIDDPSTHGKRIALCGPRVYTLRELVEYTDKQAGLNHRIIPLPDSVSRMQANVFEWIPGKPFSLDNYNSLKVDSVCEDAVPEPTDIESIVPGYIRN